MRSTKFNKSIISYGTDIGIFRPNYGIEQCLL